MYSWLNALTWDNFPLLMDAAASFWWAPSIYSPQGKISRSFYYSPLLALCRTLKALDSKNCTRAIAKMVRCLLPQWEIRVWKSKAPIIATLTPWPARMNYPTYYSHVSLISCLTLRIGGPRHFLRGKKVWIEKWSSRWWQSYHKCALAL